MTTWARCAVFVAVALCALCEIASAEMISAVNVQESGPIESIELGMVEPKIAACEATSPFRHTTRSSTADARASICGDKTTCGELLPYLAYMKKSPCKERLVYAGFADELLALCDDFPYKQIDPKWILVGKPSKPSHKESL